MLFRVSCEACRLSSLWTDDPSSFLETVCMRYRHCEARVEEEVFGVRRGPCRIERVNGDAEEKRRRASAQPRAQAASR